MRYAIILLLLAGCEQVPSDEMTVKRVFVKDEAELKRYCGDDLIAEPLGCARGGAMVIPRSGRCTIYVYKPRGFDDHRRIETVGHEVHHCFEGAKHI